MVHQALDRLGQIGHGDGSGLAGAGLIDRLAQPVDGAAHLASNAGSAAWLGGVIQGLKAGGDAGSMFDSLREGLAAPLVGMGISFSSSLFGLAGSLVLGFLDLQSSQAQNRFYTELEDWLSTTVYDHGIEPAAGVSGVGVTGEVRSAIDQLRQAVDAAGSGKAANAAMANLAEAIQGLVHHMRTEQQMIRDWVDGQAETQREIKKLLEVISRERVGR